MSEKNENGSQDGCSRRNFLRNTELLGASVALGIGTSGTAKAEVPCKLSPDEKSSSEENYEWRKSNSDYYEDTDSSTYDHLTEIQSGLVYKYSEYSQNSGTWTHEFRSFGAGYTQRKRSWESSSGYDPIDWMDYQKLEITNDDPYRVILWTTSNGDQVGAAPPPEDKSGQHLNWGAAAFTVAIGALARNPYAAVAVTAGQALAALADTGESDSGDTQTYPYNYEWQNGPCEAIHYARYKFESKDGYSHADFHVKHTVTHCAHYGIDNRYDVYVDPMSGGVQSIEESNTAETTTSESRPDPGTPEYIDFLEQRDDVVKIPNDQIQDPDRKEHAAGGPVYRALNPYSKVTKSSSRAGSGPE